jgi:hypothetical protein
MPNAAHHTCAKLGCHHAHLDSQLTQVWKLVSIATITLVPVFSTQCSRPRPLVRRTVGLLRHPPAAGFVSVEIPLAAGVADNALRGL